MNHELNALVAEKVMKWKSMERVSGPPSWIDHPRIYRALPDFGGDISAAWLVVEKLLTMGFSYEISGGMDADRPAGYPVGHNVNFWIKKHVRVFVAWGAATPEAICRAALKAVGVEVPA